MTHLKPGDKAPHFNRIDQNRAGLALEELEGDWAVLYFYPQSDTPGCTTEACGFRDRWAAFKERGVHVVGVSADEYFVQSKFVDKYDLPFTLLADHDRQMIQDYGVETSWEHEGTVYWGAKRVTFLIDREGIIRKVYENVRPEDHAEEILADLEALQQAA